MSSGSNFIFFIHTHTHIHTQKYEIAGSDGSSVLILGKLHTFFPSGCTCTFPPTGHRGPVSPLSHQHLSSLVFSVTESNTREVASHCGFDLHFPCDW